MDMTTTLQKHATDTALFLIRTVLAAVFVFHGSQKLFGWFGGYGIAATAGFMETIGIPFPTLSALLAGVTEFGGGIILLAGTGTRIAVIPMAFTMLVAIATVHRGGFNAQSGGMEYPLTLGVVLVALALIGPGHLTVGGLFTGLRNPDIVSPAKKGRPTVEGGAGVVAQ
jgi:putative oxidoreductase